MVVIWFPCWSPGWSMGWDINATLLFFYPTAPRTSCLGSPVARYQSGKEVAHYHRPSESRPVNSTRRETYQQLAACNSPPYSGWFAPLTILPGSPADLCTCVGTSGRRKAQKVTEAPLYEALEKGQCMLED